MFLCYKEPANMSYFGWEKEALPLGNGKIGAKVFGGVDCELIQFNEKTLWSGGKECKKFNGGIDNPDGGKAVKKIQDLLNSGNDAQATSAMKSLEGNMNGFGAYQTFGNLYFQFDEKLPSTSYVRDLDLDTASSMVTFKSNKDIYTRHYFVSYPDNVFVARLECESEDEKTSLNFDSYFVSEQKGTPISKDDYILLQGNVNANKGIDASPSEFQNSMKYGCAVRFLSDSGEITATENGHIKVKNAKSVVIIVSLKTNYVNSFPDFFSDNDPLEQAKATVESASEYSFGDLYRRHLKDYKTLYNRVKFDLCQEDITHPTDYMLKRFTKRGEYKRNLITLLFQYGRYLLIASSRDGSLPANLQGIWNAKNNPPWNCDYHFNVNVQMNYWPAFVTNLAETATPYLDFMNSLKKPGRILANKTLGIGENLENGEPDTEKATGWLIHTTVSPLGFVGPGDSWKWGWAPTNGAWATQNMYDYYLFTLDIDKLRNEIYPIMEECALMWSQLLIEDKKSGRLVCSPGFSPEHGPVSAGNAYDQSIIYGLFENVIEASKILQSKGFQNDVNVALIEKIKTQIQRLEPVQIGKWGQVKEWYNEDEFFMRGFLSKGVQKHHRHISQLLSLYPYSLITSDNKKFADAAMVTLNDRGKKSTGWALAFRLLLFARLGKEQDCDEIIKQIIDTQIMKNLFGTHPPFQIDGNFGLTAGIAEMLLQSHCGYIHLLPALPESWVDGSIEGLMARGNFEVSIFWKNKKLKEAKIISKSAGICKIKYDGKIMLIKDKDGNEIETQFENGITSFETAVKETYTIC